MPSLLDTIDKLAYTANTLHLAAVSSNSEVMGPFTRVMLHSSLQHIIREADETEYHLFQFVTRENDPSTLRPGKLGRKEYQAATPLRPRRVADKAKDEEPEVYLEAALRYLDRFRSIKPMPGTRAHLESLIERLDHARNQVDELQKAMQEERAINDLKSQISQLKIKKDATRDAITSTAKQASRSTLVRPTAGLRSQTIRPRTSLTKKKSTQIRLHLSSPSPTPHILSPTSVPIVNDHHDDETTVTVSRLDADSFPVPTLSESESQVSNLVPQIPSPSTEERISDSSPPMSEACETATITPETERICEKIWNTVADLLIPGNRFAQAGNIPTARDTIMILEIISAQTVSDAINSKTFSPSTLSAISVILGVEVHPPPTGVFHPILTALVLLTLLTSPNYSIPLNVLKVRLASKMTPIPEESPVEVAKQATTSTFRSPDYGSRAIYGCVAKKLIKIDRGGGEQIVKFEY